VTLLTAVTAALLLGTGNNLNEVALLDFRHD